MASIEINDGNFRDTYQNNDIVVLDFWAVWCGPCHQFSPIFEKVSESYPNVVFGKVDSEAEQKLSAYFGVRSIPTVIVIREGLEVFRNSGVIGETDLKKLIEQIQSADMEKLKKELEETE